MIKNFIASIITVSILLTHGSLASKQQLYFNNSLEDLGSSSSTAVRAIDEFSQKGWSLVKLGIVETATGAGTLLAAAHFFGSSDSALETCLEIHRLNSYNERLASDAITHSHVGERNCLAVLVDHGTSSLQSNYTHKFLLWTGGSLIFNGLWNLSNGLRHLAQSEWTLRQIGSEIYKEKNS